MVGSPAAGNGEAYQIHHLQQFFHSLRTQVTSIHHNVSSVLAETFGVAWRPSGEPVWLLGRRYEPELDSAAPAPGDGRTAAAPSEAADAEAAADAQTASDASDAQSKAKATTANSEEGGPGRGVPVYKPSVEFVEAWGQISRMTYRKGFAPMYRCVKSQEAAGGEEAQRQYIRLTSDAGWGCMIRVGQMLLATALKRHQQHCAGPGRGCQSTLPRQQAAPNEAEAFGPLEQKFLDDKRSDFSIFRFIEVALGREVTAPPVKEDSGRSTAGSLPPFERQPRFTRQLTKKDAGDWFGPTTISETIAALVEQGPLSLHSSLAVYVGVDGMLYEDEVRALAFGDDSSPHPEPSPRTFAEHKRCSSADSDDEFTVVSAAPVMSAATLLLSPQLSTAPQSPAQDQLETAYSLEATCDFELPPPLIPEHAGVSSASSPVGATANPRWRRAVLLLFPLQLGLEKNVSKYYVSALLRYFKLRTSLGAMGGRPRMAHFFAGCQGGDLLYVDPHVVQAAALPATQGQSGDAANVGSISSETFRNLPTVQAIPIEHIDSSISLAFYCCCESDLLELIEHLNSIDAEEENALVRSEAERPPELRSHQVHRPWSDSDCFATDFSADAAMQRREAVEDCAPTGMTHADLVLMEMTAESPKACHTQSRDSSFDLADEVVGDPAGCEPRASRVQTDSDSRREATEENPQERKEKTKPRMDVNCDESAVEELGCARDKPKMSVGSAWACIEAPTWV